MGVPNSNGRDSARYVWFKYDGCGLQCDGCGLQNDGCGLQSYVRG